MEPTKQLLTQSDPNNMHMEKSFKQEEKHFKFKFSTLLPTNPGAINLLIA